MTRFRHPLVLGVFIAVLFCFLVLTAFLLTYQQRTLLRSNSYQEAKHDLDLMADASLEALLKSDYVTVRTFLERWGKNYRKVHMLQAVSPNGFVLAEYRNPASEPGETFLLSKKIEIGKTELVTLYLEGDYHTADMLAAHLRNRLAFGAIFITVMLGLSLWSLMQKMAMAPLADAVEERTRALSVANQDLEQEMAERQRAEVALREHEQHITLLLNSIAEGIYGVDLSEKCIFCNPAGLRLLGYERVEDVIGKNIHQLIHHTRPDSSLYHKEECKVLKCHHTEDNIHVDDEVFWRSDGTSFPVEYWAQPIMRDGAPIGAVVAFVDITARKRAEEELRKSEERLHVILESTDDGILAVNASGKTIMKNRRFADLWRIPAPLIASREDMGMLQCMVEQLTDPDGFLEKMEALYNTTKFDKDIIVFKDGRIFERYSAPMLYEGSVIGRLWSFRDITEKQKLEDELRQVQKMESVGTLAGGIAHDFNNILTAIIGYGHIALMKLDPVSPQRQNIVNILASADRATYLTQGLLAFSRKQMSNKKQVDLNDIMKKIENFLQRIIGEDIEFITNLHSTSLPVFVDQNQIEQVLMNLSTNARDAMPKGGALTVALESVLLGDEFLKRYGFGKPGIYGMVTVSDTGIGMSEEIQKRMFEPFYTTKEVGKGTGLGLSIIYGIVKQHNGFITVESEPDKGTTFRMYLPIIEPAVDERIATEQPAVPARGTETILIAEDEETLRELMRSMFEEFGYEVIVAVNGEDAVNRFAENKHRINLFLSDLIMPKKTGKEAYDEIRQMRPDIKTIFMSGYSPDVVRDKTALGNGANIVYKPISPMDLLKKVRKVLDGHHEIV